MCHLKTINIHLHDLSLIFMIQFANFFSCTLADSPAKSLCVIHCCFCDSCGQLARQPSCPSIRKLVVCPSPTRYQSPVSLERFNYVSQVLLAEGV